MYAEQFLNLFRCCFHENIIESKRFHTQIYRISIIHHRDKIITAIEVKCFHIYFESKQLPEDFTAWKLTDSEGVEPKLQVYYDRQTWNLRRLTAMLCCTKIFSMRSPETSRSAPKIYHFVMLETVWVFSRKSKKNKRNKT